MNRLREDAKGHELNFNKVFNDMRKNNFTVFNQAYAAINDIEWICFASLNFGSEAKILFEIAEPVYINKTMQRIEQSVVRAKLHHCDRVEFNEMTVGLGEKGKDIIIQDIEKELYKLNYKISSYIQFNRNQSLERVLVIHC